MSSVLKGNFEPKNPVKIEEEVVKEADGVEARFEREALKRLGGSIAFVAKKKVMWGAQPAEKAAKESKEEKAAKAEKPAK